MAKIKTKANPIKITTFGLGTNTGGLPSVHGGKGAGLIEMCREGLPVPPGFIIQAQHCLEYAKSPARVMKRVAAALDKPLAMLTGARGEDQLPLLSVRSGAKVSMPGMMDTILNVGAFSEGMTPWHVSHPRLTLDCMRRFRQMYGQVVCGIEAEEHEKILRAAREEAGVEFDHEIPDNLLSQVVADFGNLEDMKSPGIDLKETLLRCIEAVFKSWFNPRAIEYRKLNSIPDDLGTAVIIQQMVFGNQPNSGSGVVFSKDPSTGEDCPVGEFLENAQGEEVVSGTRTPVDINDMSEEWQEQLWTPLGLLETIYQDMVEVEFTVENGKLWLLQVRPGKRTGLAAFRIARTLIEDQEADTKSVLRRLTSKTLADAQAPAFKIEPEVFNECVGKMASPGVAAGIAVSTPKVAEQLIKHATPFIWCAVETSPDDIKYMAAAAGILTEVGGITSHAAVVARGMNKPCMTQVAKATSYPKINAILAMDANQGLVGQLDALDGIPEILQGGLDDPAIQFCLDAAAKEKKIIRDVSLWDGGPARIVVREWLNNPKSGAGSITLKNLLDTVEKDAGYLQDVILDLSIPLVPNEDKMLLGLFTEPSTDAPGLRLAKLIHWLMEHPIPGLILDGLDDDTAKLLASKGYYTIKEVSTLKEALEAKSYVRLDPRITQALGYPTQWISDTFEVNVAPERMTPAQILDAKI